MRKTCSLESTRRKTRKPLDLIQWPTHKQFNTWFSVSNMESGHAAPMDVRPRFAAPSTLSLIIILVGDAGTSMMPYCQALWMKPLGGRGIALLGEDRARNLPIRGVPGPSALARNYQRLLANSDPTEND
jgi:hypothetical protein